MDSSITIENKRRDFMLMMKNVVLVGGEDKSNSSDLGVRLPVMIGVLASVGRVYEVDVGAGGAAGGS